MRTGLEGTASTAKASSLDEMVRRVIGRHLEIAPESITPWTDLQRELDLDPLDLALIALRIENLEELEFPLAKLEGVRTVGQLALIVKAMRERRDRRGGESGEPAPHESRTRTASSARR